TGLRRPLAISRCSTKSGETCRISIGLMNRASDGSWLFFIKPLDLFILKATIFVWRAFTFSKAFSINPAAAASNIFFFRCLVAARRPFRSLRTIFPSCRNTEEFVSRRHGFANQDIGGHPHLQLWPLFAGDSQLCSRSSRRRCRDYCCRRRF